MESRMNPTQIKKLQKAVGVHDDGIIGRGTLTAVFKKLLIKCPSHSLFDDQLLLHQLWIFKISYIIF